MANSNAEVCSKEMDVVIKYGNEARNELKSFSDQVVSKSDKSYEVLCNMDKSYDESQ